MKTALYLRVSTEDQAKEGYSLEVQREVLEAFAKKEGLEVYKVYSDDGISGYTSDRPALNTLLADAKSGKFGLVLVSKLDRFSRNLRDLLNLVDELCSYGAGFKSAGEPFDTTTSAGKLMFQQLGSFAEFERNRIAERVFPGMVKGVQQGNWQGARYAPYGYTYNKVVKLLEIAPDEAEVVRRIYALYQEGKSTLAIGAALTKKGVRNRKGNYFGTKVIGDILKSPIYTGKIVWNTHHYDKTKKTPKGYKYVKNPANQVITALGKHTPIISDEAFAQAQQLRAEKRIALRRARPGDYILSGLLFCGDCNHTFVGASSVSNHRTKATKKWYRCSSRTRSYTTCHNKSVKAEDLEPQLAEILEILLRNDKLRCQWTNMTLLETKLPEDQKEAKREVSQLLSDNFAKQAKLTDAYLDSHLSKEVFEAKNKDLMAEGEELKKVSAMCELRQIDREKSAAYLTQVHTYLSDGKPQKPKLGPAETKRLFGLLFRNIKISDKKIINAEFFAPFNFLFFEEKYKCRNRKNQNRPTFLPGQPSHPSKSVYLLSDDLWGRFRLALYRFLKNLYRSSA